MFSYGCIADILGVNHNTHEVYEYEFKRTSYDLKIAEKRKDKYNTSIRNQYHRKYEGYFKFAEECPKPHRFYFVVPMELWQKEKEYFSEQEFCGVIAWQEKHVAGYYDFISMKKVKKRFKNTQKYEIVLRDIAARATNIVCYNYLELLKGD